MINDLLKTPKEIEELLEGDNEKVLWRLEYKFYNNQLNHLQYERIQHLLATIGMGLGGLITCFVVIFNPMLPLFLLTLIFMIMFSLYIVHYRKLENNAQSWYTLLEEIKKREVEEIRTRGRHRRPKDIDERHPKR